MQSIVIHTGAIALLAAAFAGPASAAEDVTAVKVAKPDASKLRGVDRLVIVCTTLMWALVLFSPACDAHMTIGENTLAPDAFTAFCLRKPERCASSDHVQQITLDNDKLQQLIRVNIAVNRAITPQANPPGRELPWRENAKIGNCVQYVLAKRSQLLDLGFPSSALLLVVATIPSGEDHLVLIVVTDRGDYVLDNLRANVVYWRKLFYRWVDRSSPKNPLLWQAITPGFETASYSVKK